MAAPTKIHVVSKSYLQRWASPDGLLRARDVQYDTAHDKTAAAVGWRPQWWGAGDPELNQACETACRSLENAIAPLFRDVDARWPFIGGDRALMAQFVALHVLRTPAFLRWFVAEREQSLERLRASWKSATPFQAFAEPMRSDGERAHKLLLNTNKVATSVASMHWTLVRFDEPLLITSDQPVVGMPLLDDGQLHVVAAMPDGGWNNTVEVRFPLGPRHLLLASWAIAPEGPPVTGRWEDALDHNVAVLGQTDRHWIRSCDRVPALPPRVHAVHHSRQLDCRSIAQDVIPGYTHDVARSSERRHTASRAVSELIEARDDHTISVVGCAFPTAA